MDSLKRILLKIGFIVFCTLSGGIVGVILLILFTLFISYWSIYSSGGDPSAGAVSIVGSLLVPLAAQYGLIIGFIISIVYPWIRSRGKRLKNPRTGGLSKRRIPR